MAFLLMVAFLSVFATHAPKAHAQTASGPATAACKIANDAVVVALGQMGLVCLGAAIQEGLDPINDIACALASGALSIAMERQGAACQATPATQPPRYPVTYASMDGQPDAQSLFQDATISVNDPNQVLGETNTLEATTVDEGLDSYGQDVLQLNFYGYADFSGGGGGDGGGGGGGDGGGGCGNGPCLESP